MHCIYSRPTWFIALTLLVGIVTIVCAEVLGLLKEK